MENKFPPQIFINTPKFWKQLIILEIPAGNPFDLVTVSITKAQIVLIQLSYEFDSGAEGFLHQECSAEALSPKKGGGNSCAMQNHSCH